MMAAAYSILFPKVTCPERPSETMRRFRRGVSITGSPEVIVVSSGYEAPAVGMTPINRTLSVMLVAIPL